MYSPFLPWSSWPTGFPLHHKQPTQLCTDLPGDPITFLDLSLLVCNMRVLEKIAAKIPSTAFNHVYFLLLFHLPNTGCLHSTTSLLRYIYGPRLLTVSLPYLTTTLMNKRSTFMFYYNCIPRTWKRTQVFKCAIYIYPPRTLNGKRVISSTNSARKLDNHIWKKWS